MPEFAGTVSEGYSGSETGLSVHYDRYQRYLAKIEPFLLPTDPEKEIFWEDLGPKIEVVRRLARKYADVYLPMNGILTNSLIEKVPTEELSYDGVHLSDPGCAIMAKEYLKAWATIEK